MSVRTVGIAVEYVAPRTLRRMRKRQWQAKNRTQSQTKIDQVVFEHWDVLLLFEIHCIRPTVHMIYCIRPTVHMIYCVSAFTIIATLCVITRNHSDSVNQ